MQTTERISNDPAYTQLNHVVPYNTTTRPSIMWIVLLKVVVFRLKDVFRFAISFFCSHRFAISTKYVFPFFLQLFNFFTSTAFHYEVPIIKFLLFHYPAPTCQSSMKYLEFCQEFFYCSSMHRKHTWTTCFLKLLALTLRMDILSLHFIGLRLNLSGNLKTEIFQRNKGEKNCKIHLPGRYVDFGIIFPLLFQQEIAIHLGPLRFRSRTPRPMKCRRRKR